MDTPGLIYEWDDSGLQKRLKTMIGQCTDLTPVFEIIEEIGITSIKKNFEEYGRPGWPELAVPTMEQRKKAGSWPGKILVRSGALSNIHSDITNNSVIWSPGSGSDKYAAIHNFGGMAGRGKKVKIPKREYLLLQEEDHVEIMAALSDHVMEEN